jgi:hypothetical protein
MPSRGHRGGIGLDWHIRSIVTVAIAVRLGLRFELLGKFASEVRNDGI